MEVYYCDLDKFKRFLLINCFNFKISYICKDSVKCNLTKIDISRNDLQLICIFRNDFEIDYLCDVGETEKGRKIMMHLVEKIRELMCKGC